MADENDYGIEGVQATLSDEGSAGSGDASPNPEPVAVVDGETTAVEPVWPQNETGSAARDVYLPALAR